MDLENLELRTSTRKAFTMPRQRPKKLAVGRQTEGKSTSERGQQSGSDSDSDNESLGMLEKDAEEEELDRLVLGDGAGFKAQLGHQMEVDINISPENANEVVDGDSEGEAGLENVDDAEVRDNCYFSPHWRN